MMKRAVLTLATASALMAQNSVEGPTVGWVYDAGNAALRSVLGIPGSSTLGRNLELGFGLSQATVSPDGRIAIATDGEGRMMLVDLRAGGTPTPLGESITAADDVVFSAKGTAALLVYRSAGKAIVLSSISDGAAATREVAFPSGMPDLFAVSDDAELILASSTESLMAVDNAGNRWNMNFNGAARDVRFAGQSHDALVTNAQGVWLIRDAAANAEKSLLWEGDATQALLAADRKSALILTAGRTLVAVNLESSASPVIECSCEPQLLARMSDSVIRVTTLSGGPLWLVDWNNQEPRTVFVPAEAKSEQ